MEFVALDVETANADVASICQVGIALFRESKVVEEWKTYVDPEDYFDGINVSIHGIDETVVKGAPVLTKIAKDVCRFLDSRIAVCHTHFDRAAVTQAFEKYELRTPACTWLDSACVARRAWPEFSQRGYGLANVCTFLNYSFTPHDALEDAKAAGCVLNNAIAASGLSIEEWLKRVRLPIDPSKHDIHRAGDSSGPLYGEVIVFTGALQIPRAEAADLAARVGCCVDSSVTRHTTILVVGDQDVKRLAGHEKSSKHRKAEELIRKGQSLRIVRETDFRKLVESTCRQETA